MMPEAEPMPSRSAPLASRGRWARAALLLVGVAAVVLLGRQLGGAIPQFIDWVHGLGAWGPIVFVAGYVLATVAFVPGSVLTLVGGAVFGLFWGVVYVFTGATLGAAAAFLVSRYLARPLVERRLRGNPRFERIDRAVGREGGKIVLLLRLSPALPFNLLNYALGLTRVRFRAYLVASVGMLPGTLLYVYYGRLAGDVASVLGGAGVERGVGYYALLGAGLVATIAVTLYVTRLARRALAEETGGEA
jgi:uncharacterized membrane protein YdjX (TVP38/TMEM64 family)